MINNIALYFKAFQIVTGYTSSIIQYRLKWRIFGTADAHCVLTSDDVCLAGNHGYVKSAVLLVLNLYFYGVEFKTSNCIPFGTECINFFNKTEISGFSEVN